MSWLSQQEERTLVVSQRRQEEEVGTFSSQKTDLFSETRGHFPVMIVATKPGKRKHDFSNQLKRKGWTYNLMDNVYVIFYDIFSCLSMSEDTLCA